LPAGPQHPDARLRTRGPGIDAFRDVVDATRVVVADGNQQSYGCSQQVPNDEEPMPTTRDTRIRLTTGLSALVRIGRHLSVRAAGSLYGDLPSYGWAMLIPLERDGEQRASALASAVGIDVSVASRQVAVLERAGYVQRRPDPRDGRASLLRLTEAGADALATTRALRDDWAASALAAWDEDDCVRLSDLVERLVGDLEHAAAAEPGRSLTSRAAS
jgi:DNA-binding MarR family transcriptional regulator